jgi:hypothetical protein
MQAISRVWILKPGLSRQCPPKYLSMVLDISGYSLRIFPTNLFSKEGGFDENGFIAPPLD